jgi:pimeloyl-ACP methyl ester carboxylesterase
MIDKKSGLEFQRYGSNSNSLIFIHGGFLGFKSYRPFLKALGNFFSVYAINLPGHGLSAEYMEDVDIPNSIGSFIKSLNLNNITLIGHSFGAYSALLAAEIQNQISRIILVNPLIPPIAYTTYQIVKIFILEILTNIIKNPLSIFSYIRATSDVLRNIWIKRTSYLRTFKKIMQVLHKNVEFNSVNGDIQILLLTGKSDLVLPPKYLTRLRRYYPKLKYYQLNGSHDLGLNSFQDIISILIKDQLHVS